MSIAPSTATRAERACPCFWSAFHSGYTGATVKNTEIRNELRVPLTLAVFARSHQFLHGVTEEDLVRDPIQERVPCGHHSERERYPRFALSVANEGEKFRSCWTPYASRLRR